MNHLNKETLIAEVAALTGLPKATVKKILEAQAFVIKQAFLDGFKVSVPGLGLAKPFWRKPRPLSEKLTGRTGMTLPSIGIRLRLVPDLRAAVKDSAPEEEEG